MTSSPSVTGELDAHVPLSARVASCGTFSAATRSQTVLPVLRSRARTVYLCATRGCTPPSGAWEASSDAAAGTAVATKTRSPQTTGEADPRPGISTFQRTFFVSLHSTGGLAVFDTPVALGPRHWPQ